MVYKCIVVGFDGSEASRKAISKTVELAKALNSKLIVVTVIPPVTIFLGELLLPEYQPSPEFVRIVEENLKKLEEELRREGVDVDTRVVEGDPAIELLNVAKEEGCGLIVVGRRGKGLERMLLGSVSAKLVSRARGIDVLIVEPES